MASAIGLLGKGHSILEKVARLYVTNFLRQYVSTGCLILSEDGGRGTVETTFEGTKKGCSVKCKLTLHDPAQFYWKVMTGADLGLADAYINGDFSLADKEKGLENLFTILNANRITNSSRSKLNKLRRRLWDACLSPARYLFLQRNTLTQARRNVSHYDLSNELFSIFLDETMSYSNAVFKKDDEDLKAGQLRKINTLIQKARITKNHEVLEIGCGWGGFAIEVVKQSGCRYTGITLSEEQLKFAEQKVKDAGLDQERIKFLLCDYRTLPQNYKYDRIVSCEMVEHVGHEYLEEFFACCDSALAENGLLVLQFTSLPDELYDEYRQCSSFIREYFFPGGCIPSLSRLTSAMAASSSLCVEHLENIGRHYYRTLKYWRKNFLENQSEILALGFDDKFIRTWEYYFDYTAVGYNACTMGSYQIVFSRPGNVAVLNDPYKGFPSAY